MTRVDLRATPDGQPLYAHWLPGARRSDMWTAPGTRPGMTAQTSTVSPVRE